MKTYKWQAVLLVHQRYVARGLTPKQSYERLRKVVGSELAGMAYLVG